MTDAHCHVSASDPTVKELLVGRDFFGLHPWETLEKDAGEIRRSLEELKGEWARNPSCGVGEIGLDRLKVREIPPVMRETYAEQLAFALASDRPIVLHGAKCWGETLKAFPASASLAHVLFHGFSRSGGLIPEIAARGGFISVGPAILNDHAVNYRALVKTIPRANLLLETDRTESSEEVRLEDVLLKTAELLGISPETLERETDENARRFCPKILV